MLRVVSVISGTFDVFSLLLQKVETEVNLRKTSTHVHLLTGMYYIRCTFYIYVFSFTQCDAQAPSPQITSDNSNSNKHPITIKSARAPRHNRFLFMMNTNTSELSVRSSLPGLHPKLTDETSAVDVCRSQSCLTRWLCHENMPVDGEPGQLRRVDTPRPVSYRVLSHWLLPWHIG